MASGLGRVVKGRSSVGFSRENWLAPFVVTTKEWITEIVRLADVKENDVFYDVGCGEGHVVSYVAKNTNAKKIVGIEHNVDLANTAKDQLNTIDSKRIEIRHQDAFTADMSDCTVAYLYLTIEGMKKFEKKLCKMLESGIRVVSMWPRYCDEKAREICTETISHYNPSSKSFSYQQSHTYALKIYLWTPRLQNVENNGGQKPT
mmetsp:Transcript_31151/g.54762  ORF Transcript_31151/g.54762 Transcript_31151/m.54762 type:complete len:203 (+) Transcript_31151:2-610(+)